MIFLPTAQGQVCNNDYDYYYNNDGHYNNRHYKKHQRHYKTKRYYSHDNLSIRSFERRVKRGIRSGELTRNEARKIRHKLERLIRYENKVYRNGYVTRRESKKLRKMKIHLDNMIYDAKHNRRHRY